MFRPAVDVKTTGLAGSHYGMGWFVTEVERGLSIWHHGSMPNVVADDFEGGISHENTATVIASDNDSNSDTASDNATVDFTDVTVGIDVEKLVSVDGGLTWIDADNPTGPYAVEGSIVQFKFVVTNNSPVVLDNISLVDSDFSVAGCTISATLAAGASFECAISTTAAMGQHTDRQGVG